jgi:chaperone BCS1
MDIFSTLTVDQVSDYLVSQLDNEFLIGIVGGGLISAFLFAFRSVPFAILRFLQRRFIQEIEVDNTTSGFYKLKNVLHRRKDLRNSPRQRIGTVENGGSYEDSERNFLITPGWGPHLMFFGLLPVVISLGRDEDGLSKEKREYYTFFVLRPFKGVIERIIQEAYTANNGDEVECFTWNYDYFSGEATIPSRTRETVCSDVLDDIIDDAQQFLSSASTYKDYGIPHRRGYLFHGPPGTGKSTVSLVLATELNLPIYRINLGSIDDDGLERAIRNCPKKCIVLMEDIDSVGVDRETDDDDKKKKKLTLSCLLNNIDGVTAGSGRILIMTSNHPDKLDPALIRPGRVDCKYELGLIDSADARAFIKDRTGQNYEGAMDAKISGAELQSILLRMV